MATKYINKMEERLAKASEERAKTKKQPKLNVGKGGYEYTDEDKGIPPNPGGYEHTQAEWDEIRDRSSSTKPTTLKNEQYKPESKKESKPTPEGEKGSVNREDNKEAIGPDMGKVNKEESKSSWTDPHEQARKMLGFKRGGKTKCMSKGGSSASRRADGCAIRGKTRGRMV